MDKTKSPNFILPINIMWLESLKEDNLYTGDKPLEFILVPKCPLFRDSTVKKQWSSQLCFWKENRIVLLYKLK